MRFRFGIWDWDLKLGINIGDWGLKLGIEDWDWGLELGIGIGIGDWD